MCWYFRASQQYLDCEITPLRQKYEYKPYAFAFQTDSPYLGLFNYYINRLRENGALERTKNEIEPSPQECPDQTGKALGMKNCFGAFLVMMSGFGAGLVVLIFESFMKKTLCKETKQQSNWIEEVGRRTPEQTCERHLVVSKSNTLRRRHQSCT